jgi:hypothetical protein
MAAPLRNLLDGIVRQEQPGARPGPTGVERTVRSQDPDTPFRAGPG